MTTAINKINRRAARIKSGNGRVKPGQSHSFPDAASVGDFGWQGDLKITLVDEIPNGLDRVESPTAGDRQLVPGNTQGAKHCLDSLDGVQLFRLSEWGPGYEGLVGPAVKLNAERTVQHPTHGDVILPAGTYSFTYQREFDAEQKRERRARD